MALIRPLADLIHAQRGHLFPWAAVAYAIGITIFFALNTEPSIYAIWVIAIAGFCLALAAYRLAAWAVSPLIWALVMAAAGFATAGWRTHDVAAPVLGWPYYGPVEGRVVGLDRSASDAVRITLDQVRMGRISPVACGCCTPRI